MTTNAVGSHAAQSRSGMASLTMTASLAPIVWGSTYLVTTELLPADRPMTAAVLRALPAGLLLLLVRPGLPPPGWRWKTAVLGLLNIGAFFPLLFIAAYRLPGGLAAVIGSTQPLIIIGLALMLGWGKPRSAQVLWSLVALIGVAMATMTGTASMDMLGVAVGVAGAFSMAMGLLLTKRWGLPHGMHPVTSTAWQLIVGGTLIVPLIPLVDHGDWGINVSSVSGYLWLSVIGGAVAYSLWFRSARVVPSANLALLGILSPLTAAILGWVVLDQSLSALQSVGFALALAGSLLGQLGGSPDKSARNKPPIPTNL